MTDLDKAIQSLWLDCLVILRECSKVAARIERTKCADALESQGFTEMAEIVRDRTSDE